MNCFLCEVGQVPDIDTLFDRYVNPWVRTLTAREMTGLFLHQWLWLGLSLQFATVCRNDGMCHARVWIWILLQMNAPTLLTIQLHTAYCILTKCGVIPTDQASRATPERCPWKFALRVGSHEQFEFQLLERQELYELCTVRPAQPRAVVRFKTELLGCGP